MRASYGAFSHQDILNLTWRQFEVYMDAFTFVLNAEGGDAGQKENKRRDAETISGEVGLDERQKAIEIAKRYKNRGERKAGPVRSLV
jgi:hypothetical protein